MPSKTTCPLCLEPLGALLGRVTCSECGAVQHAACARELGGCHGEPVSELPWRRPDPPAPWWTVGGGSAAPQARRTEPRPVAGPRGRRRARFGTAALVACGLVGLGFAIAGVDPLAWRRLFLVGGMLLLSTLLGLVAGATWRMRDDVSPGAPAAAAAALTLGSGIGALASLLYAVLHSLPLF